MRGLTRAPSWIPGRSISLNPWKAPNHPRGRLGGARLPVSCHGLPPITFSFPVRKAARLVDDLRIAHCDFVRVTEQANMISQSCLDISGLMEASFKQFFDARLRRR